MSSNAIAFYIGLFGSIHCIGMCGPLAFAIPARGSDKWLLLWDKSIYQLGRVVSYTLLGTLIGFLGRQLWLLGIQKGISLLSGVLILLAAISRWLKWSFANRANSSKFLRGINQAITYALQQRWGHFAVGMLNGLLPCGFVYIALLGAVNTYSVKDAAVYMIYFGIGTAPLMLLAAVGSGFISVPLRRRLNRIVPYFMLCLACWFILRGLGLNIPYLSPAIDAGSAVCR